MSLSDLKPDSGFTARPVARGLAGRPSSETPALDGSSRAHIECDINVDSLAYWNDPQGTRDVNYKSPFAIEVRKSGPVCDDDEWRTVSHALTCSCAGRYKVYFIHARSRWLEQHSYVHGNHLRDCRSIRANTGASARTTAVSASRKSRLVGSTFSFLGICTLTLSRDRCRSVAGQRKEGTRICRFFPAAYRRIPKTSASHYNGTISKTRGWQRWTPTRSRGEQGRVV